MRSETCKEMYCSTSSITTEMRNVKMVETIRWNSNTQTLNGVKQLLTEKGFPQLGRRLLQRFTFGTREGLRGGRRSPITTVKRPVCTVQNKIKVLLYSMHVVVMFVPFESLPKDSLAAAMATASRNPKEDNLYCGNGAQIMSSREKNMQTATLNNLEPKRSSWQTDILRETQVPEISFEDI
uniref:Uncharacterized protein n=1 Tax=Glossina austeni TaxID=7395 RepID=A0A1A9UCT5_GLOAU